MNQSVSKICFILAFMLFAACSSSPRQISRDARYPAHWWTPVSTQGKPDWEILPQEAGAGEVILSKRNELGLLSNFAPTPFEFRGKRYASLEGFWQMMLYPENETDERARFPGVEWKYTREEIAQMSAFEAKAAGTLAEENMKKAGIDWVTLALPENSPKLDCSRELLNCSRELMNIIVC